MFGADPPLQGFFHETVFKVKHTEAHTSPWLVQFCCFQQCNYCSLAEAARGALRFNTSKWGFVANSGSKRTGCVTAAAGKTRRGLSGHGSLPHLSVAGLHTANSS